jgi:hypothetical protein
MSKTNDVCGLICILMLLALSLPAAAEDGQNAATNLTLNMTDNITAINATTATTAIADTRNAAPIILGAGKRQGGKVLRAGAEKSKPLNNLDMYGNRSTHVIPPQVPAQWAFDISQRGGNVSEFTYTNAFKPLYNISQYSRIKAIYQAPSSLSTRPVYSISGYPNVKIASGIP